MNLIDVARRPSVTRKHKYRPKKDFHPGGHKGKLHRELGVPVDQPIGTHRIAVAAHSRQPRQSVATRDPRADDGRLEP